MANTFQGYQTLGERFRAIQAAVKQAAGLPVEDAGSSVGLKEKPVQIQMVSSGAVLTVDADTAIQRILQNVAGLVE
jgi:hypothetical protein